MINSQYHGGGEYIKSVFLRLLELSDEKQEIYVYLNKKLFLDEKIKRAINKHKIKVYDVSGPSDIKYIFEKNNIDVFYTGITDLSVNYEKVVPANIYKICTIHDLRTIDLPCDKYMWKYYEGYKSFLAYLLNYCKYFYSSMNKYKTKRVLRTFDEFIFVSNYTYSSIKRIFPGFKKISNICYTPAKSYVEPCKSDTFDVMPSKYILLVSANRYEKNSYRAILALLNLLKKDQFKMYKVLLVGKLPDKVAKLIKNNSAFINLPYIKASELESLYSNCELFLYPSLYEGFGMPPLEAMRYGKTCVVSINSSMPEVCGKYAYYTNPYVVKNIENTLIDALSNKLSNEKVKQYFNDMKQKQDNDLEKICKIILRQNNG